MKKILIYILLTSAVFVAKATEIQTLQGQFRQLREQAMFATPQESQGVFYYMADSLLRWEYTTPNSFGIIANGQNIKLLKDGKITSAENAHALQTMVNMIMQTISVNNLEDNTQFQIQTNVAGNETTLILTPKKRGARAMFTRMEIILDPSGILAKQVKMQEKSGDITTIIFSNLQLNKSIDKSLF